jgi:hypothetical protein
MVRIKRENLSFHGRSGGRGLSTSYNLLRLAGWLQQLACLGLSSRFNRGGGPLSPFTLLPLFSKVNTPVLARCV